MSDRPTRDCQCKRANHQHGTAAAYRTDGCRCARCSAAQAEDVRAYRLQQITGRNNYRAEATRVRDHVAVLRDTWGLSPNAIATTAGVSHQTIYRLDTAERITRRAGAALLRVTLDDLPDDALVNARGVHRRVQALATLGWAPRWIASQIHYGNPTHILTVNRCRLGTHRAVAALYEDLWDQPRPVESLDDMRARQRVMNRATREGWAPPAAWDDIDLDDAPAVVDAPESLAERRRQDAIDLVAGGVAPAIVAQRLGMSVRGLQNMLTDAGREDLAAEVAHAHQVWKDAA